MHKKGTLTFWNDEKGYGFITPETGGGRTFVHIKAFRGGQPRPVVNQTLNYGPSVDRQGRPRAVNVDIDAGGVTEKSRSTRGHSSIMFGLFFLLFVGGCVLLGFIPPQVLILYLVVSLITFVLYALDKAAARRGAWRTSENTLHLLALAGGWPGASFAQQILRHKSSKRSFRSVFWFTVLLNCGLYIWLFTSGGPAMLQSFLYRLSY